MWFLNHKDAQSLTPVSELNTAVGRPITLQPDGWDLSLLLSILGTSWKFHLRNLSPKTKLLEYVFDSPYSSYFRMILVYYIYIYICMYDYTYIYIYTLGGGGSPNRGRGGMVTFMWTCVMKLMLRHAWGRVGWGGVGWDGNVHVNLRHEVDATSRMGWGGVGWGGMVTFMWTCVMNLMLRHAWGGVGWDGIVHVNLRHEVDATSRMGWGGLGWGGVGW